MTINSQDDLNQPETHSTEVLLEAISELETTIEELGRVTKLYARAKWWLNEIVNSHRCTPISTAELAIKDLEELEK